MENKWIKQTNKWQTNVSGTSLSGQTPNLSIILNSFLTLQLHVLFLENCFTSTFKYRYRLWPLLTSSLTWINVRQSYNWLILPCCAVNLIISCVTLWLPISFRGKDKFSLHTLLPFVVSPVLSPWLIAYTFCSRHHIRVFAFCYSFCLDHSSGYLLRPFPMFKCLLMRPNLTTWPWPLT